MHISRSTVEFMAKVFGEQSLSYQALQKAKTMGGDCFFVFIQGQYLVASRVH